MPPITNPTAIKFSNEKIRTDADRMAQSYNWAKQVLAEWTALGGVGLIPNTSDVIDDGSDVDGRPVITGAMANNVINRASEIVTDYEAAGSAKLNTVLQVSVNPNP